MYKVLIVDDDRAVRYILKRFDWQQYSFVVTAEAADGREALEKLAAASYDLVVTDIRMPGMNGMEFLQAMHENKDRTCIILLSTYNDFEYAQRGIRLGVFDYMIKPVDTGELAQVLERAAVFIASRLVQTADGCSDLQLLAKQSLPEYFSAVPMPSRLVLSICEFVMRHVGEDVTLEAVAGGLGLSRDYAGRVFKKKTGINFVEYVTRVKMEQAKKLLQEGGYKNYEVSEMLGYRTPDYFTQLFKKYAGMTPLEYRSSVQKI